MKSKSKKHFIFKLTATQDFEILWDIKASSQKEAVKAVQRKFKDVQINRWSWASGSLEDNKGLSSDWTPTSDAIVAIDLEVEN